MLTEDMTIASSVTMPGQNPAHAKFWEIFFRDNHSAAMPAEWQHELSNYLFHGFTPGSFHESLFANDLFSATSLSHPANEWIWIQSFMYFLFHYAPTESWGSHAKVKEWLKLSEEERFKICHTKNLVMTNAEVTWHTVATSK